PSADDFEDGGRAMLQWKIGDTRITQLVELVSDDGGVPVLPDATPENLADIPWLKPHFVTSDGRLILDLRLLVIETPQQTLVVDTCIGNDKALNWEACANMQGPFLDDLAKHGYHPESSDRVIC